MSATPTDLLPDSFLEDHHISRKTLVPLWIKIFAWIFIVFGAVTPVVVAMGFLGGSNFALSVYAINATSVSSVEGVIVVTVFILKGIVAYGLLKRENWAVNLGLIDAASGIIICVATMILSVTNNTDFSFRLELVALVPYLLYLLKIREKWLVAEKN